MKKWSTYMWKLIWVIGLFLLTIISYDIKYKIKDISASTYRIEPLFWANFVILFIWGVYLSLIFIKKWTIKINYPLLICVFIPCFLFSLFVFLPLSLPIGGTWYIKIMSSQLIEIVAGLTFMLSIFSDSKRKSE